MTAPANGYNPGNGQYGFVGSVVTGHTLGDGYIQSDVVTWQGVRAVWRLGCRVAAKQSGDSLGLTGYAFVYEPYGNSGLPGTSGLRG